MKILSWNVRGLGNPRTVWRLRHSLKLYNPQIVFFMETKIIKNQMERIRRRCGFQNGIDVDSNGSRGGLCLAWRDDVTISLRSFSKRHIDVIIEDTDEGNRWRFTGFYGSTYMQGRNESWDLLKNLRNAEELPWFVCGDFNEIMYGHEKRGGLPREERHMDAFRTLLTDCHLVDVGYIGNWFTWKRGNLPETNIQERLDRGVTNEDWLSLFLDAIIQHLPHSFSDHCPLLINKKREDNERPKRSFKFEAWWVLEESFAEEVRYIWDNSTGELVQKLEKVSIGLTRWASQIRRSRKIKKEMLTARLVELMNLIGMMKIWQNLLIRRSN
ncbi:uncharacterized protein [Gossypium hirsutum]|uniref:Endonuclease/exonuclease/phosphatase domain-containing protein n=1 Tax=Gossypium hirsutum TaxID=3635 RepID=A0A1U8HV94_GOSHI|nr:uncharacterized protein LOC107889912 [Gossypium hirsutum]